jgi:NADP-reducing hydrogenase subunit HndC
MRNLDEESDMTKNSITTDKLKQIAEKENKKLSGYKAMLMTCTGTGCVSAKGFDILETLKETLKEKGLDNDYMAVGTGCNGFCAAGPIVVVQPEGTFYQKLKKKDVAKIVESHLMGGKPVEELLYKDPVTGTVHETMDDIKFFSKQQLIALRNKGLIDPEDIDQYIARDGYDAIRKVLADKNPDAVIQEVIKSGIRGRGGGGFPAGVKWESGKKARIERDEVIYVVCNADEGDPGAYMDRSIIEADPHSLIEGMMIGAYAVGASEGYVYIRKEYPLATERLEKAIAAAREYGLLGENILGSDFSFDLIIHRGAGAFVCGESTALMASMSGRAGEPRAKYVHNVEYGYRDKPTILNNVETWVNIPVIIEKGFQWFASIGTGNVTENPWNGSSGTKVFSLVGDIRNTGLVEVPMGITLREIIEDIGGGIPNGREFKAVQTGGPSGGCIPASLLDMQVNFDSLTEAGSMMGSGGMIVMDDHTCMVDVARYFVEFLVDESCGKCTPCREGLFALSKTLNRICSGEGTMEDLNYLEEVSKTIIDTSLCQLGGSAPNPVLSTIRYFREEYEEHINEKKCRGGVCKPLIKYTINKGCTGCTACAIQCPVDAISGEKKGMHTIDLDTCIKCGICFEVCKFNAVEVK